jgi:hypothetical protein
VAAVIGPWWRLAGFLLATAMLAFGVALVAWAVAAMADAAWVVLPAGLSWPPERTPAPAWEPRPVQPDPPPDPDDSPRPMAPDSFAAWFRRWGGGIR